MGYRFTDLTAACQDDWRAYTEHDFVRSLGAGTLAEDAFRHYLQQDYLFLIHFARAYALAAYKSRTLADLRQAHEGLKAIVDVELGLHVGYCREWNISEEALASLPEARATMAYTRYVLDTGNRGDLLDLHALPMAPCPCPKRATHDSIDGSSLRPRPARPTHLEHRPVGQPFIGLTIGLRGLQVDADDVDTLRVGIASMINGAAIAFLTSVWGLRNKGRLTG
ncbi:TenA family protein [Halomonas chromatireducens]|uniref:Thiaminase-2 n=1 Tax=Halomonas chromatireducens TaxID=507626 RepID=A0A0X8HFG3_9GAMM|nr:TenA family protein [Halomonas chromatireducens]AMD01600.1 Thiaminase-2 [Halomonas chromatireducens]